ncbi:hypothetical protein FHS51_001756 [Sphingobium wenxiniae]|nr:hypothetical protein [Sphingobium wenxiniae]
MTAAGWFIAGNLVSLGLAFRHRRAIMRWLVRYQY